MNTLLVVIVAALMILARVALIAFDIFARAFNHIFDRMLRRRRAGYGALIILVLLYVALRSFPAHH